MQTQEQQGLVLKTKDWDGERPHIHREIDIYHRMLARLRIFLALADPSAIRISVVPKWINTVLKADPSR